MSYYVGQHVKNQRNDGVIYRIIMSFGCVLRLDTNDEIGEDFHENYLYEDEECLKLNRKNKLNELQQKMLEG